jgi:hypothetical protein
MSFHECRVANVEGELQNFLQSKIDTNHCHVCLKNLTVQLALFWRRIYLTCVFGLICIGEPASLSAVRARAASIRCLSSGVVPFKFQDVFEDAQKDETPYRKLTSDYVSTVAGPNGLKFLKVGVQPSWLFLYAVYASGLDSSVDILPYFIVLSSLSVKQTKWHVDVKSV